VKVVFVYKEAESLAIEYLSAVLEANGHETSLVYESFLFDSEYVSVPAISGRAGRPKKTAARIVAEKPDLVAFSIVSDYYPWACAVAEELKKISDLPVVFGGIHVTALPHRVMEKPFVDFAVIGEGEYALLDLANALEAKRSVSEIPNLWSKSDGTVTQNPPRPAIDDLDSLPFPNKRVFIEKVPIYQEIYYIQTSRGCPYKCTYCCNSLLHGLYHGRSYLRKRTPENVIEELVRSGREQPFKMVFFLDDDFASDREWLEEFLESYKRRVGAIFRCITHPRNIDGSVARMLADAGCRRVQIGVQTWNEELKRRVCHRYETNQQIVRACEAVKEAGIYLDVDQILGLPLHEESDYVEAVRMYARVRPDHINCFWMRYYPGTEIIEFARSHGLLSDQDIEEIEEGAQKDYLKGGSVEDVRPLARVQALLTLVPFLTPRSIEWLLRRRYDGWLLRSFFVFLVVPRLIQMPFHEDMWYNFRRSLLKFPPFRR
jgi:radical SAM superfamily enzyme YgiQ (UPF0313 family)